MDYEAWVQTQMQIAIKLYREKNKRQLIGLQSQEVPGAAPKKLSVFETKFDPNAMNKRGETLAICVVRYLIDEEKQIRYLRILRLLGADLNLPDSRGRNLLMFSLTNRRQKLAVLLINQYHVTLWAQDKNGNTILMYAAIYGLKSVLSVILGIFIRQNRLEEALRVKNCMGNTAAKLAWKNGNFNCYKLLKSENILAIEKMFKKCNVIKDNFEEDEKNFEENEKNFEQKEKNCKLIEENPMPSKIRRSKSMVAENRIIRKWTKNTRKSK